MPTGTTSLRGCRARGRARPRPHPRRLRRDATGRTARLRPPGRPRQAIAVLRTAVELGINHFDTADFYGPYVTNEIIREALAPYDGIHLVTKVGARRDDAGGWHPVHDPEALVQQVHDNLQRLGLDTLDIVNLRVMGSHAAGFDVPGSDSIAPQFEALAELQQAGLIRHLGLSTVSAEQLAEAQAIAPVVCVQNFYNLAHREDEHLLSLTAEQGIAYVPYFPLGGFTPLQSSALSSLAGELGATEMSVALAWLLQRSANVLLIPGTSSVDHLRENVAGAGLELPDEAIRRLDALVQQHDDALDGAGRTAVPDLNHRTTRMTGRDIAERHRAASPSAESGALCAKCAQRADL